jgi:hypothetical protein
MGALDKYRSTSSAPAAPAEEPAAPAAEAAPARPLTKYRKREVGPIPAVRPEVAEGATKMVTEGRPQNTDALRAGFEKKYGVPGHANPISEGLAAGAIGLGQGVFGQEGAANVTPGDTQMNRDKAQILEREYPGIVGTARTVGGVLPWVANPLGKVAGGVSMAGNALRGAVAGALPGAAGGDASEAAKGAAIGVPMALLPGVKAPKAIVPETTTAMRAFVQNKVAPKAAAAARYSPLAVTGVMGGMQAIQDPTEAGKVQGLTTLGLPAAAGAVSLLGRGGAERITPARQQAERLIDDAAAHAANKRVQAERDTFRKQMDDVHGRAREVSETADADVRSAQETFDKKAAYARELEDIQQQEFLDQKKAYEAREELRRQEHFERKAQDEARQEIGREEVVARRAQDEARQDIGRQEVQDQRAQEASKQNTQRQEYVARARNQAQAELDGAFASALEQFKSDKQRMRKATPEKPAVSPEDQATGEYRQAVGAGGNRLDKFETAVERKIVKPNPELSELYQYAMDSLSRNMDTPDIKIVREAKDLGGMKAWVEQRAKQIAAENEARNAGGGGAGTAREPGPQRPVRQRVEGVPRNPELEAQIISRRSDPDPTKIMPSSVAPDPTKIMPSSVAPDPTQIFASGPEGPDPRRVFSYNSSIPHPNGRRERWPFRWIEGSPTPADRPKPFAEYLKLREEHLPDAVDLTPVPESGPGLKRLLDHYADESRIKQLREAPGNVREKMTFEGRVPESRSIVEQYNLENPRLHLSNLLNTARDRRVASDVLRGAQDFKRSPLESFINESTPAEAAYILGLVEKARGKVDARREALARTTGGAAVTSTLQNDRDKDRKEGR